MSAKTTLELLRRPDGTIDTAYYIARGRTLRSRAAHKVLGLRRARKT